MRIMDLMVGKRVALVLGSGGARGYAHIGAIDVLTERGYEIVAVAGSSMGALVGGLHAAGKLHDYTEWVTSLNQRDVLRLLDVSLNGPGVLRLERVLARMTEYLNGVLIEDLPIPYTAVASDLGARREVWITSGPLETAIRASIAIPAMITPIMVNGRLLVDGGVLNPVPMEPVMGVDADFTLAINLSGEKAHHVGSSPTWWAFSPLRLMASVKSASTPMTGSIGTGLSTPPSTSRRPFTMIGVIIAGIAIDALIAVSSGPLVNHTSRRAPRSLATAVYGIGRSSIITPSRYSVLRPSTRWSRRTPGLFRET